MLARKYLLKIIVEDYYRRLLQKTIVIAEDYTLIERSIWESLTRRSLIIAISSILYFEDVSLYFVYLINNYILR